jgi:repressor of nif and glnA expression
MQNNIAKRILELIESSDEPLETMEIVERLKDISRTMILYRLHDLRGEGLIKGKRVGGGKGVWIWWRKNAFESP